MLQYVSSLQTNAEVNQAIYRGIIAICFLYIAIRFWRIVTALVVIAASGKPCIVIALNILFKHAMIAESVSSCIVIVLDILFKHGMIAGSIKPCIVIVV